MGLIFHKLGRHMAYRTSYSQAVLKPIFDFAVI